MPLVVPPATPVTTLTAPYIASTPTPGKFGNFVLGPVSSDATVAGGRASGDYLARFAAKEVATTRELLYTCPSDCRAVIMRISFANISGAARSVQLWVAGVQYEPGLALAIGEAKGESGAKEVLLPGEKIEAQASGAGVNAFISGVEEVS